MINVRHSSFLYIHLFFNSLHVSSTSCSSSRDTNCINTTTDRCHSVLVAVSCAGRKFTFDLHTTQPPTKSDSYQRLYWYNLSLLMMSTMCSKHAELKIKNKYIEKNCASCWSFTKNHYMMHGQQNITSTHMSVRRLSFLKLWIWRTWSTMLTQWPTCPCDKGTNSLFLTCILFLNILSWAWVQAYISIKSLKKMRPTANLDIYIEMLIIY
jgi:hypothetical protein